MALCGTAALALETVQLATAVCSTNSSTEVNVVAHVTLLYLKGPVRNYTQISPAEENKLVRGLFEYIRSTEYI